MLLTFIVENNLIQSWQNYLHCVHCKSWPPRDTCPTTIWLHPPCLPFAVLDNQCFVRLWLYHPHFSRKLHVASWNDFFVEYCYQVNNIIWYSSMTMSALWIVWAICYHEEAEVMWVQLSTLLGFSLFICHNDPLSHHAIIQGTIITNPSATWQTPIVRKVWVVWGHPG